MKCQAITDEGKRCTFTASAEVAHKHYCGNHANKVKATQMFDRSADEPHKKPEVQYVPRKADQPMDVDQVLNMVCMMMDGDMPRKLVLLTLTQWKAGEL